MKLKIFWPFLVFLLIAPFTPAIDLKASHFFYSDGSFYDNPFFSFLYHWGERFGFFASGFFFLLLAMSFLKKKWAKLRKPALSMLLTFVLGAGVITNSLLKEHWGRPRPKQVDVFGGKHAYRPFWKPVFDTKHEPQKSFPSGHVAMGFYFLSLCLVGRRLKAKPIFYIGFFLTAFLGGGLMIARVAQGGHFFSDVLASSVLMWGVALLVDKALYEWKKEKSHRVTSEGSAQPAHEATLPDTFP